MNVIIYTPVITHTAYSLQIIEVKGSVTIYNIGAVGFSVTTVTTCKHW